MTSSASATAWARRSLGRSSSSPVAFLLAGEMAVAYFLSHAPQGFWPILNRGEVAALFCFIWLYLAAAGPGSWSLDALAIAHPALRSPSRMSRS